MCSKEWKNISELGKDMVKKLLEYNPKKRLSATKALNHPWIKEYCEKKHVEAPILGSSLENLKAFNSTTKL